MFIENTEELAQNKLLLLYLIDISDYDLSKNKIVEFILENDYMNYFLIQQYLSELLSSNFINIDEETLVYSITGLGSTTLSYFKDRLPVDFKNHVKKSFVKSLDMTKLESEVLYEFYQKETGQYVVNLKLVEGEDILFSIYLDVPSLEEAQRISKLWTDNTQQVYQDIISVLMDKPLASENETKNLEDKK